MASLTRESAGLTAGLGVPIGSDGKKLGVWRGTRVAYLAAFKAPLAAGGKTPPMRSNPVPIWLHGLSVIRTTSTSFKSTGTKAHMEMLMAPGILASGSTKTLGATTGIDIRSNSFQLDPKLTPLFIKL